MYSNGWKHLIDAKKEADIYEYVSLSYGEILEIIELVEYLGDITLEEVEKQYQ